MPFSPWTHLVTSRNTRLYIDGATAWEHVATLDRAIPDIDVPEQKNDYLNEAVPSYGNLWASIRATLGMTPDGFDRIVQLAGSSKTSKPTLAKFYIDYESNLPASGHKYLRFDGFIHHWTIDTASRSEQPVNIIVDIRVTSNLVTSSSAPNRATAI